MPEIEDRDRVGQHDRYFRIEQLAMSGDVREVNKLISAFRGYRQEVDKLASRLPSGLILELRAVDWTAGL